MTAWHAPMLTGDKPEGYRLGASRVYGFKRPGNVSRELHCGVTVLLPIGLAPFVVGLGDSNAVYDLQTRSD
jgi:hypothetical protein